MAGEDAVARFQQFRLAGKILAVERPVRMIIQLLEPFVGTVDRQKESDGVGDMDGDRHVEGAAGFPHCVKSHVIHLHQLSGGDVFPQVEAERLENLHAAGAVAVCLPDGLALKLGIAGLVGAGIPGFHECIKTSRMFGVVFLDGIPQAFAVAPCQVDHRLDVPSVHHFQELFGRRQELPFFDHRHSLL
jgi:hypothetical protein